LHPFVNANDKNGKKNIEFSLPLLAFCEIVLCSSSQLAKSACQIQIWLRLFWRLLLFPENQNFLGTLRITATKTISQNIRFVSQCLLSLMPLSSS